jgi:2',3'-cyclic-nucleotide 2'-phosphodiesterase (5'-nucleotidase family)
VINDTVFAQVGGFSEHIGIIEIMSSGEKRARTIAVTDELPACEAVAALITQEEARVEPIISEVIGFSPFYLDGKRENVRTGETNLSNIITDSNFSKLLTISTTAISSSRLIAIAKWRFSIAKSSSIAGELK